MEYMKIKKWYTVTWIVIKQKCKKKEQIGYERRGENKVNEKRGRE